MVGSQVFARYIDPKKLAMKILLFEWLNSGGLWLDGVSPSEDCPIQRQGCQMLNAVTEDLLAGGCEVAALVDSRLTGAVVADKRVTHHEVGASVDLPAVLLSLAQNSDAVLVIAPETNSILSRCLNWLEPVKHKLLNPDAAFTKLASSKSELFEYLKAKGFGQFPDGINFQKFLDQVDPSDRSDWDSAFGLPAVLKPDDGAGSEEVELITDWASWSQKHSRPNDQYRLESFVPGTAVSVSVLCGGDQCDVLTPTIQLFDESDADDDADVDAPGGTLGGHYVGAEFPIAKDISRRAVRLVCEVLKSLPKTRGYIGMDLVISDSGDRLDDRLIEINPRLTMSYSRLTQIYGSAANWGADPSNLPCNLAMQMVQRALEPATDAPVTCTFREPGL